MTSENLQARLTKCLTARMGVNGSLEYALTWKQWDMLSGVPICALRARARRISDNDYSGWPTPLANKLTPQTRADFTPNLAAVALLAGWPTPQVREKGGGDYADPAKALNRLESGHQINLADVATLAGWSTPSSRDWKDSSGMATTGVNPDGSMRNRTDQLPRQVALISGQTLTLSGAPTEKRGALNPEHSRWLMGFPAEWGNCAPTAMPSSRKSRPGS